MDFRAKVFSNISTSFGSAIAQRLNSACLAFKACFPHSCCQRWNAKKCWELWLHTLHILHSKTPRNKLQRTESYFLNGSWTDTALRLCWSRLRVCIGRNKGLTDSSSLCVPSWHLWQTLANFAHSFLFQFLTFWVTQPDSYGKKKITTTHISQS